jgi:hypothetical protein
MRMKRAILPVLAAACAAGAVFLALSAAMPAARADVPPEPPPVVPDAYFPVAIGNTWVYSWSNSVCAPSPIRETVVVTEQQGSVYSLHAHNDWGVDGTFKISTTVGYRWMSYNTGGGQDPCPLHLHMVLKYMYVPRNLFTATIQTGDSWSGTNTWGGLTFTGTTTAVALTSTVSAGPLIYTSCLQIRTVITGASSYGAGVRDAWFAPAVGMVRMAYYHEDGSVTSAELELGPRVYSLFLPTVLRNN